LKIAKSRWYSQEQRWQRGTVSEAVFALTFGQRWDSQRWDSQRWDKQEIQ
jgi:hypothetical protein